MMQSEKLIRIYLYVDNFDAFTLANLTAVFLLFVKLESATQHSGAQWGNYPKSCITFSDFEWVQSILLHLFDVLQWPSSDLPT